MPRIYKRKEGVTPRGTWTEEALRQAWQAVVQTKNMNVAAAAKFFGIPVRTLRRRIKKADLTKHGLGKGPVLGYENEKNLANHVQNLEKAGFHVTRLAVRKMAYELAIKLKIDHTFNNDDKMAGKQWMLSFLERNNNLSLKPTEDARRAIGLNRQEVQEFFNLLKVTLEENDLFDKPDRIFNMSESEIQVTNDPEKVETTEGINFVQSVSEEDEIVSIIACNNVECRFLPPVIIMKGESEEGEFVDSLPPGSAFYMNKDSACSNTELFYKWLTEHFIPRKPAGKVLLILDGHASHVAYVDTLEKAIENDVILLGVPNSHVLQPLGESFFRPLKTYLDSELQNWILNNGEKKINRYQVCNLIGTAWDRAVTISNAVNGFRASGICPYNPKIILDHYFDISDVADPPDDTEISKTLEICIKQETDWIQEIPDEETSKYLVSAPDSSESTINEEKSRLSSASG